MWPEHKVILELDSSFHDDPIARRADAERDAETLIAGWGTIRVRAPQVRREPHRVVALIATRLSRLDFAPRSA